jgi:hypothetical protein
VHQTNEDGSNDEGGGRIKSPLNIDAPAFDPPIKDFSDANHETNTNISTH